MDSIALIEKLSNANGISGFEDEVTQIVRKELPKSFLVKEDTLRNLYISPRESSADTPLIMLDAHSDEVGFMVQSITGNGMLKFLPIGGWTAQNVPAHKVRVRNANGDYIPGVVASKPPHFMSSGEKNKLTEISDMQIDVGAVSREEVIETFNIEPGAPVVPDAEFSHNTQNGIMMGKAFDNRLGTAAVIETLTSLSAENLDVNLVGTISSQEEVGLRGAQVAAHTADPQVAILFEGTPADDTHTDKFGIQAALKKGPQIRHRDGSMIANPRFVKFARQVAKDNNLPFQDAVRTSGGTNGGRIHLSKHGIPTIVIGVPVRYAHTHYGYASLGDYENAVKWGCALIKALNKEIIDSF